MAIDEQNKKINLLLEDLAALESYVHDLFIFSPLPTCFVSPLGVILEVNPAFAKISNFSFSEIIGEPIEKLFNKEDVEDLAQKTLKRDSVIEREIRFFPKGKKELICQVFTQARKDEKGKSVGYFLGVFDLTKLKKGEKELKKSQTALLNILEDTEEARQRAEEEKNKTQTIITSFADGLLVFDNEQCLSLLNPKAEDFLKLKAERVVSKSLRQLGKIKNLRGLINILGRPVSAKASAGRPVGRASSSAGKEIKKVFRKEWQVREDLVLEISTIPLGKEEAGPKGTLVVLHDITREKIIERLKTEFVSISAHQLRTPLSAIKWTLRMLLDGDLGRINKEQKEFLEKTYRSNERMIDLINSLLNVTRIEEGRFLYRPILMDLSEIVESVIESLQEEIKRRQIDFKFVKPEKKLPKVMADREKIRLAIQNLIDNAVRYTLPGGRVKVSLKQTNGEIKFKVEDSGLGIPKNQQDRVFRKFFRGVNAVRLETEGSGLGLFIAKNVIEAHNGKIWFESEENKGATFYFTLPIFKK